jgi:hypothetical protein
MDTTPELATIEKRTWKRLIQWEPCPIELPAVHPELAKLNDLQRSAEVFRYWILSFEHWLSPQGALREWLRLNVVIGITLVIPALLIVPVGTYLLSEFVTWTALMIQIVKNLAIFPIAVIGLVLLLMTGALILRILSRR